MATNKNLITILIADDHAVVRMGLSALLNQQKGLKVVGEADDGAAAVKLAGQLKPDVAILDLMMPVMGGVEATQKIKSVSSDTKILLLTSYGTSMDIVRAVTFGASGALLKDTPNDELIAAVREIANGGEHFSRSIRALLRETPQPPSLSEQQMHLLDAAARGYTTEDIAKSYGLSPDNVKRSFRQICDCLGAANRTEAVAIALKRHLLKI